MVCLQFSHALNAIVNGSLGDIPRHDAWIEWLELISDLFAWSAFLALSGILCHLIVSRRDLPFASVFWLFAGLTLFGGTARLMEALSMHWPSFWADELFKLITAGFSWAAVFALAHALPKIMTLRSPRQLEMSVAERTSELKSANKALKTEIDRNLRTGARLREQQELFHGTLASLTEAVIVLRVDGCVSFMNRSAERLAGRKLWQVAGKPLNEVLQSRMPETGAVLTLPYSTVGTFDTINERQRYPVIVGDGQETPVLVTSTPILDEQEMTGVVMLIRDVTDRLRNEAATLFVSEATRKLAAIAGQPDALLQCALVCLPDLADICLVCLHDMTGAVRDVAVARSQRRGVKQVARELRTRLARDDGRLLMRRTIQSNEPLLVEAIADPEHELGITLPGTGSTKTAKSASAICVPLVCSGKVVGTITWVRQPSRPAYDSHDLPLAEEMAGRIASAVERSRLMSEIRENVRRKDEFLAMLAHELRNPLAPVRNALEILERTDHNAAVAAQARKSITRQVVHLGNLVDDLLDLSRVLRGKIKLKRRPIMLQEAVEHALETVQSEMERRHHDFRVLLPDEPVWIQADETRIQQVLANLLNNAAKYTPEGGRIELSARTIGKEMSIVVCDNGIGISRDQLPHVFELFRQLENEASSGGGGLGIGLTLVRNLVQMHGGRVEARSEGLGEGSEFEIWLPIGCEPLHVGCDIADEGNPSPAPERPAHRVLVVDDNQDAAQMLSLLLSLDGHEVTVVHDGLAAIEAARHSRPDVILLDIGLPGRNGHEVAKELRADPEFSSTVLIAITGFGQDEDRRRTARAGFNHHLVKPVAPDKLRQVIQASMARRELSTATD